MVTIAEMKQKNKASGGHFFDRGNAPIVAKYNNYVLTKGMDGEGYIIYKFDPSSGRMNFIDNPQGEYSWQPFESKSEAMKYMRSLK